MANAIWKQDVSAHAFQALAGLQMQIRTLGENYEITSTGMVEGQVHLMSAVLMLDHHLRPVSETLRVRGESGLREVRFVQADDERQPSSSVPDSVFDPADLDVNSSGDQGPSSPGSYYNHPGAMDADVRVVQTEIAALYELSILGADTSDPIEVARTPDGRIRISGTVADNTRKQEISSRLELLRDHQLLEIRLASQRDLGMPALAIQHTLPPATGVYTVAQTEAPTDAFLRRYFSNKGWTGERVNSAVAQFSRDALGHAQRALQHAYALDRLGSTFSVRELQSISPASERQWAEMAARHSSALESELHGLDEQLSQIAPTDGHSTLTEGGRVQIDNPEEFAHAVSQLLHQTQNLNRNIGSAFASGTSGAATQNPDTLVANAVHSIPLRNAAEIASFASQLVASDNTSNERDSIEGRRSSDRAR